MKIIKKYHKFIKYSLYNAPWALISALSAGVANYIILIILARTYGAEASGEFRLLLSIFGVLNILTLMDTGKVAVKYLVQEEKGVVRPLTAIRLKGGLIGSFFGIGASLYFLASGEDFWIPVLIMALCLPFIRPMSLWFQINQARKKFKLNAIYSILKYSSIIIVAVVLSAIDEDVFWFLSLFFIISAAFHILFSFRHDEFFESNNVNSKKFQKESIELSLTGALPLLLEHADKFLISYYFGLDVLGIYIIGVSTGRLLMHFIRPFMTIYFPYLVENRLGMNVLAAGFFSLTLLGLLAYFLVPVYIDYVLGPEYADAIPLALVIVAGLGVSFLGVAVYYSAVFHRESRMVVPVINNAVTPIIIASYLWISVLFGGEYALLLCAASYPLRELCNLVVIKLLEARR